MNLYNNMPTEKEWVLVASGYGTKPFDYTLYKEVVCQWKNGNYRVMASTWAELSTLNIEHSSTGRIDMYDSVAGVSCNFNWTNKTVDLNIGSNPGKIEMYAR